jgi:hypothetical protein
MAPVRGGGVIGLVLIGATVICLALMADQGWLDRHLLPSFFLPRPWYVRIYLVVRWSFMILGASLIVGAKRLTGLLPRIRARTAPVGLAVLLALCVSELVLRHVRLRPAEWLQPQEEPRRQPDSRLGWTLVPSRIGHAHAGGRLIEYAIDAAGYRVPQIEAPVDPALPTIVFVGESIMFGEGLTWDESVPGQVASMMHVQSANLAVHGFSTSQAYLRLERELPRFRRPIAVVSLFMPVLFGRNLDDDRPHFRPGLVWQPAVQHAKLVSLAELLVPYRRVETVQRGIDVTREVLGATVALAHARAATPLSVVLQFGAEEPVEAMLRRKIFDETGVPYARVALDPAWRLPWDLHPNAWGAHVMATAVVERLQSH